MLATVKAALLRERGGLEVLGYGDAPTPTPGPGELLIAVHAAGVTPSELEWLPTWSTREGGPRPLPVIPGHEFSGEVQAIGAGVAGFAIGDPVFGTNDWFRDGTHADACLARASDVAAKPPGIDHAAAAVTPISALTALQGLVVRGRLAADERVLIHGAAGAVGAFAVQVARLHGAHVIGTASAHNLDFVRELGADEVLDRRAVRFEEVVRDVDVVLDTVGGDTFEKSFDVLRAGGRVVTVAASSEHTDDARVRDAFFIVEPSATQLAETARLIAGGRLRPIVGSVFPLAEARRAYADRPARGKNVVAPDR